MGNAVIEEAVKADTERNECEEYGGAVGYYEVARVVLIDDVSCTECHGDCGGALGTGTVSRGVSRELNNRNLREV